MEHDEMFLVTIRVQSASGESNEEIRWVTEKTNKKIDYKARIERMHDELVQPEILDDEQVNIFCRGFKKKRKTFFKNNEEKE